MADETFALEDQFDSGIVSGSVLDKLSRLNDQYIWVADHGRRKYFYLSENFDDLLGKDRDLLLQEPDLWFQLIDEERSDYEDLLKGSGFPCEHSFKLSNLNADNYVLQEEIVPLEDGDSGEDPLIGFIEDVTTREKRINDLKRSTKFRTLGKMSSGIMHEINNPNASLQGNLDYSRRVVSRLHETLSDQLDEDDRELLEEARSALESCSRESERIEDLVDRVEVFSKEAQFSQNPELPSDSTDLNVAERILRDLTEDLDEHFDVFSDPECTVETNLDGSDETTASVPLSENRIRLVLRHLLQNALDATRETENPSINVKMRTNDRNLVVNVVDNGRGFEEPPAALLDPFHTNNAELERLGLGLSIVESITQRLEGSMNLQTRDSLGTTASVKIPLVDG